MSFFSLLFLYSYNRTDLNNVKFHVVDLGAKEDMGRLVNLMESDYCENECMIRNNELFVSRMFPLHTEIPHGNTNDKIIYPLHQ